MPWYSAPDVGCAIRSILARLRTRTSFNHIPFVVGLTLATLGASPGYAQSAPTYEQLLAYWIRLQPQFRYEDYGRSFIELMNEDLGANEFEAHRVLSTAPARLRTWVASVAVPTTFAIKGTVSFHDFDFNLGAFPLDGIGFSVECARGCAGPHSGEIGFPDFSGTIRYGGLNGWRLVMAPAPAESFLHEHPDRIVQFEATFRLSRTYSAGSSGRFISIDTRPTKIRIIGKQTVGSVISWGKLILTCDYASGTPADGC